MVIEVVTWEGATKTHAVNQNDPARTLCGTWIPERAADVLRQVRSVDEFPTCHRCGLAVMLS